MEFAISLALKLIIYQRTIVILVFQGAKVALDHKISNVQVVLKHEGY
jgi:hypothetical protein